MANHKINDKGLAAIRKFLAENHKQGTDFSDGNIIAWALVAESHADDGHGFYIELRASESVWGRTQTLELGSDFYTVEPSIETLKALYDDDSDQLTIDDVERLHTAQHISDTMLEDWVTENWL